MSEDSGHDFGELNPYQSPEHPQRGPAVGEAPRKRRNPLVIPATGLLILSSLHLVVLFILLPSMLADLRWSIFNLLHVIGSLLFNVAIIVGSINMLRLKGYRFAMTAAAAAIIPLCSPFCFAGIPFGIWAYLALSTYDVGRRFQI